MDMMTRPILMQGWKVRAILGGATQTRRLIKPRPHWSDRCSRPRLEEDGWYFTTEQPEGIYLGNGPYRCPYGRPGDRLWVRETWCALDRDGWWDVGPREKLYTVNGWPRRNGIAYLANSLRDGREDGDSRRCRLELGYRWHPSIHMPRWASRLTLRITDVRVQRVQEISWRDCRDEGVPYLIADGCESRTWEGEFERRWDAIYAKKSLGWDANPWVWALTFAVDKQETVE